VAVWRAPENPIIKPGEVPPSRQDFEVAGVFNAGVARYQDEVVLLLRVAERPIAQPNNAVLSPVYDVETDTVVLKAFARDDPDNDFSDPRLIVRPAETYLTSISHLRVARSADGVSFDVAETAAMVPAGRYETFGLEDPRITQMGDVYYIQYVAVSPTGVTTALASTRDFASFERHGVIFHPENKDVAILPDRIGGRYHALHRPHSPLFKSNDMWIAESPDLMCWGNHRRLMGPRPGMWDETRVGAGAVPFRIDEGWLEVYHGADRDNRYGLGAVLLDGAEPWSVLARSEGPIFEPAADYERGGFLGNVVFTCGLLFEDGRLGLYYGAADTVTCYAEIPLAEVLASLR
jgi:predicted GH43/DUF377 family glycosyl hydrolase